MQPDDETLLALYAGEWIATSQGRIVAHGPDFLRVAQEACARANDISLRRAPEQPPRHNTILMTRLPSLIDVLRRAPET